jgi:hypothetical protein
MIQHFFLHTPEITRNLYYCEAAKGDEDDGLPLLSDQQAALVSAALAATSSRLALASVWLK